MSITMFQDLILHKTPGKENVCVKTKHNMYEYHIEGVRFLFKHWKFWHDNLDIQPSNYCVLSSPPKSGKSATVVLFLYSIRALLHQPMLVLCKDDKKVQKWVFLFKQWTGFESDDIAVDPKKALINKQIFIKSCSELSSLSPFIRRSWSIVVVTGDDCASLPRFLHVDFTIWITCTDLTKDLPLLKSVHKWILPKVEFKMHQEIKPKWKNEILLHSVVRNYVFRSSHSIFMNHKDKELSSKSTLDHKRLKNKDVTGLKIKRSKPTTSRKEEIVDPYDNNEKMDVETFIRNEKPVTSKINKCLLDIIDNIAVSDYATNKNIVETTDDDSNIDSPDTNTTELQRSLKESPNLIENEKSSKTNENSFDIKPICKLDVDDDKLTGKKAYTNGDQVNDSNSLDESDNNDVEEKKIAGSTTDVATVKNEDKGFGNKSDLDSKLNEMQEIAMKKFKGSFLDSIF